MAYGIQKPILAINIGASAPLILTQFETNPPSITKTNKVQKDGMT